MTTEGATRKLTAILSADVVGYSRLISVDEVGTVQRLKSYKELIGVRVSEHHGRVVDSPGDNLLAEFPSALDATRCAVENQRMLKDRNTDLPTDRRMEFRIGIHLGDVMVVGDRIYGDGVNIAARLEGLADPGDICISDMIHRQVRGKLDVEFEDIGLQTVKNFPEPVRTYKIQVGSRVSALPQKEIPAPVASEEPSIAVLPFVNMSEDPSNEYFSDGVSEEILNSLVKTNSMPVIARTSSFQFKGQNLSVQKIASELNVTHIMGGSVRKAGNTVRVAAQLVDANTGRHLWSENYDRELTNIFALQDEIAGEIVKQIQAHVGRVQSRIEPGVRTQTVDEDAYDLYLRAQERFHRYDPSRRESIGLFQIAVERDPEFIDAWVGLARAYSFAYEFDSKMIPIKTAHLAKAALQRALDIDPENASALSLLGRIKALIEYKWVEGSALMERAVQLSPQDAEIHMIYGLYLELTHQANVIGELEKGYRLDPFNMEVVNIYAQYLRVQGRQVDAQKIIESAMVTGKNVNDFYAIRIYLAAQNLELVWRLHERSKAIWGADYPWVMIIEYLLAMLRGDGSRANSVEQELLRRMESEFAYYPIWGGTDTLKRRFQLAYQQRQPYFVQSILYNKPYQFSDEEWQDLREKMNIAELGGKVLPSLRPRTETEENYLLERSIELDQYVTENYVGVYRSDTSPYNLRVFTEGSQLLYGVGGTGFQFKMIAVTENQFESLEIKDFQFRFLNDGSHGYDLELTDGQIITHWKRIEQ